MIHLLLLLFSSTTLLVQSHPQKNYRSVQFIPKNASWSSTLTGNNPAQRFPRHLSLSTFGDQFFFHQFPDTTSDAAVWPSNGGGYNFYSESNGEHRSPDFSNGLAYPDKFLLRGSKAKSAATFLYSRELFFGDIPHVRAVSRVQEKRLQNGLPPNRLGSIRIHSPWYRYPNELEEIFSHPFPYEFFI